MSDIVERLRERPCRYAIETEDQAKERRQTERCEAAAEIERLRIENIQMRFALGYPMPADLERHILPSNPFKCGMCDARRKAAMDAIIDADRELI